MPAARPVQGVGDAQGPNQWFLSLPIITQCWFGASVALTLSAGFSIISPYYLFFYWEGIASKFEIWRIATCFCYAGGFEFGTLISLYMLVQFSQQYEAGGPFNTGAGGGTADYAFSLLFAVAVMLLTYPLLGSFLSGVFCKNMVFFVLYLWSKKNANAQANIWGIPIQGMYLPFAYLALTVFMGSPYFDLVHGIATGHLYYFLAEVVPVVYGKDVLRTPQFLINFFGVGHYQAPRDGAGTNAGEFGQNQGGGNNQNNNANNPPTGAAVVGGHTWGGDGRRLGRD